MITCFECDSDTNIHDHHVVPKAVGGLRTLPLCGTCHGKIHGIDLSNHGNLIKLGLVKTRAQGTRLGAPVKITEQLRQKVYALRSANNSIRSIANALDISVGTAHKIIKEYNNGT